MEQVRDVELRFAELQTQMDRLCVAIQRWQQAQERGNPAEERLGQLVDKCATAFTRLTDLDVRQEQVVARLESRLGDWSSVESRLEQDSDQRMRHIETIVEQQGEALRQIHAEPVKQLREQAANLEETSIAAANLALRGFERAEARLAALEQDIHNRMTQLAGEIRAAVAELRGEAASAGRTLPSGVSPFPLESVMRIHDEVRRTGESETGARMAAGSEAGGALTGGTAQRQLPEAASSFSTRLETLERALSSGQDEVKATAARTEDMRRIWRTGAIVAAALVVVTIAVVFLLQRRVDARLNDAAARVAAAERRADEVTQIAGQQIATTRDDAQRQITEARQTAQQAQIVGDVLAAPDLARYNLTGTNVASRAYAQFLWSRSRGFVFSGSRLPLPPKGTTYQLWLISSTGPVNGGLVTPDSAGRATLATDQPPAVPRPLTGVDVTLEPQGGSAAPTGASFLTRVPPPVPVQ